MTQKEWIVTVKDQDLHRIDEIAGELESAGLHVTRVLRSLGQVTGRTEAENDDAAATSSPPAPLTAVTGVASVDAAQRFSVSPPDSEIQ